MLGLGIVVPILPLYAKTLGASGIWVGAIFAGFSVARAVFMPIVGRLSDKTGRKTFIVSGLFLYAFSSLGYIYAYNAVSLFIVRIIQGFCSAMIVPIAMAYIGDISPKNREGSYVGKFNVALFLGFGLGPFLGGCIHDLFGVNTDFIVMGLLCGISFCLVMLYLPASDGRPHAQKIQPALFRHIIKSSQVQGIMCFRFINAFIRGSVLTFLPLYASYDLRMNGFEIGVVVSSGVLLTSFLQYPCGKLADSVNRKLLIVAGSLFYALCVVIFPFTSSYAAILCANLLSGILGAIPIPAATALVMEEGKKYGMGSIMALFNVAMSLGLGIGPLVTGLMHDVIGLHKVFYFIAACGIVGSYITARFLKSSPPAPLKETPDLLEEL